MKLVLATSRGKVVARNTLTAVTLCHPTSAFARVTHLITRHSQDSRAKHKHDTQLLLQCQVELQDCWQWKQKHHEIRRYVDGDMRPALRRNQDVRAMSLMFTVPECPSERNWVAAQDACNEERYPRCATEADHEFDDVAEGHVRKQSQVEQENADFREPGDAYVYVGEDVEVFQRQRDITEGHSPYIRAQPYVADCFLSVLRSADRGQMLQRTHTNKYQASKGYEEHLTAFISRRSWQSWRSYPNDQYDIVVKS